MDNTTTSEAVTGNVVEQASGTMNRLTAYRPSVKSQTVSVEYRDGEWWVCHANGEIEVCDTSSRAFRSVSKRDKRAVDAKSTTAAIVTTIHWRNTPDGFEPPVAR